MLADDDEDDPLYPAALAVERDERLAAEMADWDATVEDGLAPKALKALSSGHPKQLPSTPG